MACRLCMNSTAGAQSVCLLFGAFCKSTGFAQPPGNMHLHSAMHSHSLLAPVCGQTPTTLRVASAVALQQEGLRLFVGKGALAVSGTEKAHRRGRVRTKPRFRAKGMRTWRSSSRSYRTSRPPSCRTPSLFQSSRDSTLTYTKSERSHNFTRGTLALSGRGDSAHRPSLARRQCQCHWGAALSGQLAPAAPSSRACSVAKRRRCPESEDHPGLLGGG